MIAKRAIIRGRVQGVFYRNWAVENARELGLTGWVRNLAGGEVELFAQGPEERVTALLERCRGGPLAAKVHEVYIHDAEPEALDSFEKRPSV